MGKTKTPMAAVRNIFKKRFNAKTLETLVLDSLSDAHHVRFSIVNSNASPLEIVANLREKILAYQIPATLKVKLFHGTLPPDYLVCPSTEGIVYTGLCKSCNTSYRYPHPLYSSIYLSNLYCIKCCGDLFEPLEDVYVY